jgi:ZIP family zinc transporter
MPTGAIILLGAFAGLTIYLGLPIAFLKQTPQSLKVFFALAAGAILYVVAELLGVAKRFKAPELVM